MLNGAEHNLKWPKKFCVALGSAMAAMLVSYAVVVVSDLRVKGILGVGITVFLAMILILSVSRYRWMAARVLSALIIIVTWGAKAFTVEAPLTDNIYLKFAIETKSWIEPVSLTICFALLLACDIAANYVFPYLNKKLSCLTETRKSDTPLKVSITKNNDSVKAKYEGPSDKICLSIFRKILEIPTLHVSHKESQEDRNNKE